MAAGDYLEMACDLEYSGLNNVISIFPQLVDNANNLSYFMGAASADYMPMATDPLVGSAGQFGWFGWPLRFHAAPMKVASNLLSSTYKAQVYVYMDASATPNSVAALGAASGVAGTVKWRNCTVAEYHPTLQ
jgi:hypothetical protein